MSSKGTFPICKLDALIHTVVILTSVNMTFFHNFLREGFYKNPRFFHKTNLKVHTLLGCTETPKKRIIIKT